MTVQWIAKRRATCEAYEILERVISADEAGMMHADSCPVCESSRSRAECPEAMNLAQQSIYATLAAKMFLDRARPAHAHLV